MELLGAQAGEVALLRRENVLRALRRLHLGRARLRKVVLDRRVGEHLAPRLAARELHRVIRLIAVGGDCFAPRAVRRHGDLPGEDLLALFQHLDSQVVQLARSVHAQEEPAVRRLLHVERGVRVAHLDALQVPDAVPELPEHLRLAGHGPVVVRLRVGVRRHHQLHVVPHLVGEDGGGPTAVRPPAPELAAAHDVAVSDEHGAGVLAVVIAADESLRQLERKEGVAYGVVLPPAHVDVVRVGVHAREGLHGDRPVADGALGVIGGELGVLRKDDLVVGVRVRGHVRPEEHRVGVFGAVYEPSVDLHAAGARAERDADRPAHAVAALGLAQPDRLRSVVVRDEPPVARHLRGDAVMVEHVPLHAAGYPRAVHAHVRGLDRVLAVEDVVAVRLVDRVEEAAAHLRQHAHLHPFVLEVERLPRLHLAFAGVEVVVQHVRVDAAPRALVAPLAVEHRALLRRRDRIGRQVDRSFLDRNLGKCGSPRQDGERQSETRKLVFHGSIIA